MEFLLDFFSESGCLILL